jgi:uncharacterized membrane protein YecN with MAPEG domain
MCPNTEYKELFYCSLIWLFFLFLYQINQQSECCTLLTIRHIRIIYNALHYPFIKLVLMCEVRMMGILCWEVVILSFNLSILCYSFLWPLLSCLYSPCSSTVLSLNIISLPLSCHSLIQYTCLSLLLSHSSSPLVTSQFCGPLFTAACTLCSENIMSHS